MGTIQKIVTSLITQRDEKLAKLTARSDDNSAWLAKELSTLRQLVKQNPRDNLKSGGAAMAAAGCVKKTQQSAPSSSSLAANVSYSPPAANDEKENAAGPSKLSIDSKRQKRKFPETAREAATFSPQQKRSSADFEQLAQAASLPADFNKLKKETLLLELEARGDTNLTMKSLKKDLVDALRAAILQHTVAPLQQGQGQGPLSGDAQGGAAESAAKAAEQAEQADENVHAQAPAQESTYGGALQPVQQQQRQQLAPASSPVPAITAATSPAIPAAASAVPPLARSPQRKGSLLSTFRSSLVSGEAGAGAGGPVCSKHGGAAEREARLKAEFERRTLESTAHKSSLSSSSIPQAEGPSTATAAAAEGVVMSGEGMRPLGGKLSGGRIDEASGAKGLNGLKSSPALLIPSLAAMMVSPQKGEEGDNEEEAAADADADDDAATAAAAVGASSGAQQQMQQMKQVQPHALSDHTWSEVASPTRDDPAPAPAPAAEGVDVKKPSNIVASQTSFVGGGEKAKAVVPALEKVTILTLT